MPAKLSILDLAPVGEHLSAHHSFQASVELAQHAEKWGYERFWFAEHHNITSIASSAPAVLIAHIAAHTRSIRVGAGGIMLPNHSPLVIAEQFGTLESLYPGRIDLGLGRAPGGDPETYAALRRQPGAPERFPDDVAELQALLADPAPDRTILATPGAGTHVPLYILGSSLFGAQLAAAYGLPYAFASHFAPDALEAAIETYRGNFRPSRQCQKPYVIAGFNVVAAESDAAAMAIFNDTLRRMARNLLKRSNANQHIDDDVLMASPAGAHARHMLHYAAVGDARRVHNDVQRFIDYTGADEIMVVTNTIDPSVRLRSYEILAETMLSAS